MGKWGLNRADCSIILQHKIHPVSFLLEEHSACFAKAPRMEMPQKFHGRPVLVIPATEATPREQLQMSQVSLV